MRTDISHLGFKVRGKERDLERDLERAKVRGSKKER